MATVPLICRWVLVSIHYGTRSLIECSKLHRYIWLRFMIFSTQKINLWSNYTHSTEQICTYSVEKYSGMHTDLFELVCINWFKIIFGEQNHKSNSILTLKCFLLYTLEDRVLYWLLQAKLWLTNGEPQIQIMQFMWLIVEILARTS